jgi:GNAT superfamily N-acetyltransferase
MVDFSDLIPATGSTNSLKFDDLVPTPDREEAARLKQERKRAEDEARRAAEEVRRAEEEARRAADAEKQAIRAERRVLTAEQQAVSDATSPTMPEAAKPRREEQGPPAPDPFEGESFGDLSKRRGQQAVKGLAATGSGILEGVAILDQQAINQQAEEAAPFIADLNARRDSVKRTLDSGLMPGRGGGVEADADFTAQQSRALADLDAQIAEATVVGNRTAQNAGRSASESPNFKKGDALAKFTSDKFGAPDPRDTGFWAQVAEGGGNMVGFGLAGAITGPVGTIVAGSAMNAADLYKEALAANATEDTAVRAAKWGALIGSSEIVPIERALKILPKGMREGITTEFFKRALDILQSGGEEAAQEYLQTVANNIVGQQLYDAERGWTDGALNAALVGGVLGLGTGTVGAGLDMASNRGADKGRTIPPISSAPPAPPAPPVRDRLRLDSQVLTKADRESPIQTDVIDDGKTILDSIINGTSPASAAPAPIAAPAQDTPFVQAPEAAPAQAAGLSGAMAGAPVPVEGSRYKANPSGLENQINTGGPLDYSIEAKQRASNEYQKFANRNDVISESERDPLTPVFDLLSGRTPQPQNGETDGKYLTRVMNAAKSAGRDDLARAVVDVSQSQVLFLESIKKMQADDAEKGGYQTDDFRINQQIKDAKSAVLEVESSYNNMPAPDATTNPAQESGPQDNFEVVPEEDGNGNETGRMIQIDRTTGKASVVGESAPVDPVAAPVAPVAPVEQAAPVAPAPTPATADPAPSGASGIMELTNDDVLQVQTNAGAFQYKQGGDENGVTERLRGVSNWDVNRAGVALVYEAKDGTRTIVDGHQRLGFAKRAIADGQQVTMPVRIIREADGQTPQMARVAAAVKNISEGSGTSIDAAKLLRDTGKTAKEWDLPLSDPMVRDSNGLSALSDDGFRMVTNEIVPVSYGSAVGRIVKDQSKHSNILGLLSELAPSNAVMTESIIRQAEADSVTEEQTDMFGTETVSANLYLEKAKILDKALKTLGTNIRTFSNLNKNEGTITNAGNVLDAKANATQVEQDESARAELIASAYMKGPISDALTEAATALKNGGKVGDAALKFIQTVRNGPAASGQAGVGNGGTGSGNGSAQPSQAAEVKPAAAPAAPKNFIDELPEAFIDVDMFGEPIKTAAPAAATEGDNADGGMFGDLPTDDGGKGARDRDEIAVRANQSKSGKLNGSTADAGALFEQGAQPDIGIDKPADAAPKAKNDDLIRPRFKDEWYNTIVKAREAFNEIRDDAPSSVIAAGREARSDLAALVDVIDGYLQSAGLGDMMSPKAKTDTQTTTAPTAKNPESGSQGTGDMDDKARAAMPEGYTFVRTEVDAARDGQVTVFFTDGLDEFPAYGSTLEKALAEVENLAATFAQINDSVNADKAPAAKPAKAGVKFSGKRADDTASMLTLAEQDELARLRAEMRDMFKNQLNSGIDPNIAIVAGKMAAIYIKAGARKFRDLLRAMMEDMELPFKVARPYAQKAYNEARDEMDISGDDISGMDTSADVMAQVKEMISEDSANVSSTSSNVEPDRGGANTANPVGAGNVSPASGRPSNGAADGGKATDSAGGVSNGGGNVSQGNAASVGGRSNSGGSGSTRPVAGNADNQDGAGSGGNSQQGLPLDEGTTKETEQYASDNADITDRAAAQAAADKLPVTPGDEQSIRDSLPLLLPEQQDDVLKIETRYAKPDGHGMMLTNGTGTGKTYSGLGIVKRFALQGKTNIMIVAPSQGILDGWIAAGVDMGIPITKLEDSKSAGTGIVATSYANLGDNPELAKREWDLIVTDESDNLMSSASGKVTKALKNMRGITNRPADLYHKVMMIHADEWSALHPVTPKGARIQRPSDAVMKAQQALSNKIRIETDALVKSKPPRSKVLFLSATPWAYDRNTDYAEGYLFDYPADGTTDSGSNQSGQNFFMVQNFGYRIRYHKLTKPEAAVDSGVFEREMHEKLKREGVLSGRALQIEADYDRKFVRVQDAQGEQIDEALDYIRDNVDRQTDEGQDWAELQDHVAKNFNYLRRMQLLEAIKAKAAIPDIKAHLKMGRKVVVFHDYNVGGGFNPFTSEDTVIPTEGALKAYDRLLAALPFVEKLDFEGYGAPIDSLTAEFGDRAVLYDGTITNKKRAKNKDDFNRDGSGVDIIIVQSDAGKSGLSLHDVTNKHQRILINLGMPTKPTVTLQEEGRIRRVGSMSDAAFRYYTIGTNWERTAFANRIAGQSGTVENLAMGNEARTIRDSFINAYMDADFYDPSPDDGKGGKDADRSVASTSPYDVAKTHYYGRMKNTRNRNQRQGFDFYATPEPVGMKMAQWIMAREYDRVLEPSSGDGAIARYLPADTDRTLIDPSSELLSTAQLRAPGARALNEKFEDHHIVNKYDAIAMNPPFGSGGKVAMEHFEKAMRHVKPGGRIVALIPRGGAADKRFIEMYESEAAKGFYLVGEILMPSVTFEKAGTAVMTRIVVMDRLTDAESRGAAMVQSDLTNVQTIAELFDRIQDVDMPPRAIPAIEDVADVAITESLISGPTADVDASVFDVFEFFHSKTGQNKFAVHLVDRVEPDRFKEVTSVARKNGGYWSAYVNKADGVRAGFLFKNNASRAQFMADLQTPVASRDQAAYHGTPHDFDAFSLDAMGTGEGAQAYGWGMYFAGRRGVAEHYRDVLSKDSKSDNFADKYGNPASDFDRETLIEDVYMAVESQEADLIDLAGSANAFENVVLDVADSMLYGSTDGKSGAYGDVYANILNAMRDAGWTITPGKGNGKLFTVEVPEDSDLLNWNKPLSEQSDKVKAAIKSAFGTFDGSIPASQFYENLSRKVGTPIDLSPTIGGRGAPTGFIPNDKAASEALRAAGIPGHRFLDGGSRQSGEGSYNYVIYDETAVQVTNKERRADGYIMPESVADRMIPAMRAALDKMMLQRVKVTAETRRDRQGAFTVDMLGNMNILIGQSVDLMATLYHESIHAMKEMNLFTDAEWSALEAEAAKTWMKKYDIEGRYPKLNRQDQIEEAIAEAFGAWGAANGKGTQSGMIATAFAKMKRMVQAIRNAANGLGFDTSESIFGKAISGEVGSRPQNGSRTFDAKDQATDVDAFAKDLKSRLGLRDLSLSMSGADLKINMIAVDKADQKQGKGSQAMQEVVAFADDNNLRTFLSVGQKDDGFGTTSRSRLVKFYKRFGFVENKGRNKDFSISAGMLRDPVSTREQAMPVRKPATGAMLGGAYIPDRGVWDALTEGNARLFARLGNAKEASGDQIDRARIKLQDRMLPILRAQQAVERETGSKVSEKSNAYLAEETFSGKVGKHLFDIDENFTKPIIDLIGKTKGGITVDSVGEWLTARHAVERNQYIASINDQMPDGGSGMMTADALQVLYDAAAGDHAATLDDIGVLMDKLREVTVKMRVGAGLMTQDEADLWAAQYAHYVPLKGWAETDHADATLQAEQGRRFNVRGGETKRALGRSSEAFNPLQAMLTQAQEVAIRAEKNRVANAMFQLAEANPAPAMWEIKKPKMKRYFNRATGLVETRIEQPLGIIMAPNEMAVKVDGKEYRILFNDDRLARAMGNIGADQMGAAMRIASGFSRYVSTVNTMMNPEFTVTNAFRDITAASINIQSFGEADRKRIGIAMIRDWRKALAGAYGGMKGKKNTEWQKHYAEFEKAGGKVSFWVMDQPEAGKADLEKRIGLQYGSTLRKASKFVRPSLRDNPALALIERANMAVDNAVRLAAFVEARKAGWTAAQAASLSKNLTVNFNRRGEAGSSMNAIWTFANASIQGNTIILKALKSSRVRRIAVGIVGAGIVLDLINASLSDEDDDDELAYDKIPDFKNKRNLILNFTGGDNPITIPLPYGWSLFSYAGQQMGKVARGVKSPGDAVGDVLAASFETFSPMGSGTLLQIMTPTILDPVMEMAINEDWLGRPIRPESPYGDYGPDAYKAFASVRSSSAAISEGMNVATGGSRAESGAIDVSPEYLDHVFNFIAGGAGRFVGDVADIAGKVVTGQTSDIRGSSIPFAGNLYTESGIWLDSDRYYRFRDEVLEAKEARDLNKTTGAWISDNTRSLSNLADRLKVSESAMKAMRKDRRDVMGNDALSRAQKSAARKLFDERENRIVLGFNRAFVAAMGNQGE